MRPRCLMRCLGEWTGEISAHPDPYPDSDIDIAMIGFGGALQ